MGTNPFADDLPYVTFTTPNHTKDRRMCQLTDLFIRPAGKTVTLRVLAEVAFVGRDSQLTTHERVFATTHGEGQGQTELIAILLDRAGDQLVTETCTCIKIRERRRKREHGRYMEKKMMIMMKMEKKKDSWTITSICVCR